MISRFHIHVSYGESDVLLHGSYDTQAPQTCCIHRFEFEGLPLTPDQGELLTKFQRCLTHELERKLGLRPHTFPRVLPFKECTS